MISKLAALFCDFHVQRMILRNLWSIWWLVVKFTKSLQNYSLRNFENCWYINCMCHLCQCTIHIKCLYHANFSLTIWLLVFILILLHYKINAFRNQQIVGVANSFLSLSTRNQLPCIHSESCFFSFQNSIKLKVPIKKLTSAGGSTCKHILTLECAYYTRPTDHWRKCGYWAANYWIGNRCLL